MSDQPTLVLLHGWGSTAQVWHSIKSDLQTTYNVMTPELPGHGESDLQAADLESVAMALWQFIGDEKQVVLLGWSLGGLIALQMTLQRPESVSALLLVAATPCFVQRDGWSNAMAVDTYDEFEAAYVREPVKTVKRFQALQANGDAEQKRVMRELAATAAPVETSLRWGLSVLKESCLVSELSNITRPVSLLLGENDALIPSSVSHDVPGSHTVWRETGHAPFLSRPSAFVDWVNQSVAV